MIITNARYKNVYNAFVEIDRAAGAINRLESQKSRYHVPYKYADVVPIVDKQLSGLTVEERELLFDGEEQDQLLLIEQKDLSVTHQFLTAFFEDWPDSDWPDSEFPFVRSDVR